MRLRFLEHLRRFAFRAGSRDSRRESMAPEAHGRHRRSQTHPPSGQSLPVQRQPAMPPHLAPPPVVPPSAVPSAAMPWSAGPPAARPPAARPAADGTRVGAARARIREAPAEPLEAAQAAQAAPPVVNHERHETRQPWYQNVARQATEAPVAIPGRVAPPRRGLAQPGLAFAAPHPTGMLPTGDGRRNTGTLERILWRQWDSSVPPPPDVVTAIDRLAEFPERIKDKLVAGLDGIYVGPGGVPELDDMTALRGVPLPSGRATWDACAGAYGERKIVIGSRPSPTPDVTCHEIGHALDDLDSPPGKWQSDSAEFRMLYDLCQPHLVSDFHRQPGGLGRKEFFADAFAAIASSQRPALVDMLGGQTTAALRVMLYFNRRYGL
jgi:hypothetical protein